MTVIKKIDDIGRIAIPKDIRRSLRWMGGDEIEIISNDDGSLTLRKHARDTAKRLKEMAIEWADDTDVESRFLELIELIQNKTE
jgi:AbrB family looped-hinge helix DNA binding protein